MWSKKMEGIPLGFWVTLFFICAYLLAGCGGGSSNSSPAPSSPPRVDPTTISTVRSDAIQYGYFGVGDNQIPETIDQVSFAMILDWGDWDRDQVAIQLRIIAQLQDAKARGLNKAVVGLGFLTWTKDYQMKGTQYLEVFRTQLEALGLLDMVEAFYPIDEPDVAMKNGLTEANLELGLSNIHSVFPEHKLMVIYGDSGGYPAQRFYDIVGKDKYGSGSVITLPLMANQRLALVTGGADPWREDPNPAIDYAKSHPEVKYLVWFLYVDSGSSKGIKNNGMLPVYQAASKQLKG